MKKIIFVIILLLNNFIFVQNTNAQNQPSCFANELIISTGLNPSYGGGIPDYIPDELEWKTPYGLKIMSLGTTPFYGTTGIGNAGAVLQNTSQIGGIAFFTMYRDFYVCNNGNIDFSGILGINKSTLTTWPTLFRSFKLYKGTSTLIWTHATSTVGNLGNFVTNNFGGSVAVTPGQYRFVFEYEKAGSDIFKNLASVSCKIVGNSLTNSSSCCQPPPPTCKCGGWGSIGYILNNRTNKFRCESNTLLQAEQGDNFVLRPRYTCINDNGDSCGNGNIKYNIYYPNGGKLLNQTNLDRFKLDSCGINRIVMIPTCGGVACPPCEFSINVNCCKCAKDPEPMLMSGTIVNGQLKMRRDPLKCGETYTNKLECFKQYDLAVSSPCGLDCQSDEEIITILQPNGVTTIGSTLIANQTGTYTVTIKVKCNGKWCAPCVIKFVQTKKCDPPCDNCTNKVKTEFDAGTSTVSVQNYPLTSTLNALILLNGGADTYTQVRANIIDFQISSDNPACLQCYNTPNQWGSITSGSLLSFTPTISNYPSVSTFSGYNNPREIVFNAASALGIPTDSPLNLTINLPGINTISCCCIHVVLYVKITYRNNKCEECTKIERIGMKICPKTNGGTDTPTNNGGTITFDPTDGQPAYKMHAPNKEDVKKVVTQVMLLY